MSRLFCRRVFSGGLLKSPETEKYLHSSAYNRRVSVSLYSSGEIGLLSWQQGSILSFQKEFRPNSHPPIRPISILSCLIALLGSSLQKPVGRSWFFVSRCSNYLPPTPELCWSVYVIPNCISHLCWGVNCA